MGGARPPWPPPLDPCMMFPEMVGLGLIVYFTPSACRCMEILAIVLITEGVFANLFPKTGPSGKKVFYSAGP